MTDPNVVTAWGQYGLLGLVLLFLFGGGGWLVRWWLENVIKPREEANRLAVASDRETNKKLAETMAALGQVTVNIDRGVTVLMAGGQETRIDFQTNRRAWRLVADMIEAHSAGVPEGDLRDECKRIAERLRDVMDEGSKEMKSLTDEVEQQHARKGRGKR